MDPIEERTLQALAGAYRGYGLAVTEARPATPADVTAAPSTWGKRLGTGVQWPAWVLRARLESPSSTGEIASLGPGRGG